MQGTLAAEAIEGHKTWLAWVGTDHRVSPCCGGANASLEGGELPLLWSEVVVEELLEFLGSLLIWAVGGVVPFVGCPDLEGSVVAWDDELVADENVIGGSWLVGARFHCDQSDDAFGRFVGDKLEVWVLGS